MRLVVTRAATRQIGAIVDVLARRSPQGALQVRPKIADMTGLLTRHPYAGRATELEDIRRVVVRPFPYLIFYHVVGDSVVIQRVRHASRDPAVPSRMA